MLLIPAVASLVFRELLAVAEKLYTVEVYLSLDNFSCKLRRQAIAVRVHCGKAMLVYS